MKSLRFSRVCLVGILMLGFVVTWSAWGPGKMHTAIAVDHTGKCESGCGGTETDTCPTATDATGNCWHSYTNCIGDSPGTESWSGSNSCDGESCDWQDDCSCEGL